MRFSREYVHGQLLVVIGLKLPEKKPKDDVVMGLRSKRRGGAQDPLSKGPSKQPWDPLPPSNLAKKTMSTHTDTHADNNTPMN